MSLTITQNVVTGSRSLGTVFQNTSGSPILVEVYANNSNNPGNLQALCDSANPPTTQVSAEGVAGNNNNLVVVFLVPNNFFYKVSLSSTGTLVAWTECNFTAAYTTTQTNVTGSRVLGTIYQNTTGKVMFVEFVSTSTGANCTVRAFNGESSPPGIPIAQYEEPTNGQFQRLFFLVPPGYYYKITTDVGSTVVNWIEITVNTPLTVVQYTPTQYPFQRNLGTIYQATLSALIVSVSTQILGGTSVGDVTARSDTSSNPTTIVEQLTNKTAYGQVAFATPLNSYYRVDVSSAGDEVIWVEWALDISVATPNVRDNTLATEALVGGTPTVHDDVLTTGALVGGAPHVRDDVLTTGALVGGSPHVRDDVLTTGALVGGSPNVRCDYLSILVVVPRSSGFVIFVQAIT